MADKIPAVPADVEDVGPKKSFWGHLADLRTALIRSAVVIVVALVVCLLISPWIVKVLAIRTYSSQIAQRFIAGHTI